MRIQSTNIECEVCGTYNPKHVKCRNCEKNKRLLGVTCPNCKSGKVDEGNITRSNNVLGAGHNRWSIFDYLFCTACGVLFFDINKNTKDVK